VSGARPLSQTVVAVEIVHWHVRCSPPRERHERAGVRLKRLTGINLTAFPRAQAVVTLRETCMNIAFTVALLATALTACTAMEPAPCDHPLPAAPSSSASTTHVHPDYEQQTARMRQMHQRAATARTPEERAAWRRDQMKVMQDGMAMMKHMHGPMGGGMGNGASDAHSPSAAGHMGPRMEMMDLMMQMMTDREMMSAPGSP